MVEFVRFLSSQVLETLGAPWLCVVLCFALLTGGGVTFAVVNQTIRRKAKVEWVTKVGVLRLTFPPANKK